MMLAAAGVDFVFLDYTNDYQWAQYDTNLRLTVKYQKS